MSARTGPARAAGFPWLRLSLACGAAIAVLAWIAEHQDSPAADMPDAPAHPAEGAPPPLWTPVARPLAIYGIDAPHLRALPLAFGARRTAAGAREDTLAFGAFDQPAAPHLRLMLLRSPHPEVADTSLFVDLARHASRVGLAVMRSAPAEGLATKFGVAEASEATLSDGSERSCLAFRFAHPEAGFRMAGWLCPAQGRESDRRGLACVLDRLSLVEAGNDEALRRVFAEADRRRIGGCAPTPTADTIGPTVDAPVPASRSPPQARSGRTLPAAAHKAIRHEPDHGSPRNRGERGRQAEAEPPAAAARLPSGAPNNDPNLAAPA